MPPAAAAGPGKERGADSAHEEVLALLLLVEKRCQLQQRYGCARGPRSGAGAAAAHVAGDRVGRRRCLTLPVASTSRLVLLAPGRRIGPHTAQYLKRALCARLASTNIPLLAGLA